MPAVCDSGQPGVCGNCGLPTTQACSRCKAAHFCSAACLSDQFGPHEVECGSPSQPEPVPLPPPHLINCPINADLKLVGQFSAMQLSGHCSPAVFQAEVRYGLAELRILPEHTCAAASEMVNNSRCKDGYLKIGSRSFAGYEYYTILAEPMSHNPVEQARVTTMLLRSKGHLAYCMQHSEVFCDLCTHVAACVGCSVSRIHQVHFIQQLSSQCHFTWHQDHEDLKLSTSMLTVVVLLQGSNTGMQVWGFRPYTYPGVGSGVVFRGAATHRSIYQMPGRVGNVDVVKAGFFID